jgi:hypothetical protein
MEGVALPARYEQHKTDCMQDRGRDSDGLADVNAYLSRAPHQATVLHCDAVCDSCL